MIKPFLIQRSYIKAPWHWKHKFRKGAKQLKVSDLIADDYMGSAEFEFGARANTIKRFAAISKFAYVNDLANVGNNFQYEHIVVKTPSNHFIIPTIRNKSIDRNDLTCFLTSLANSKVDWLKEPAMFDLSLKEDHEVSQVPNLWWCLDEGLEFVFSYTGDERAFDAIQIWPECILNSISYMKGKQ